MAGKIQSNPEVASALASHFKAVSQAVVAFDSPTKDGDTTISGTVNEASHAIDQLTSKANSIATDIESFAECITKIDSNFQANDQAVAQEVSQLTSGD